MGRFKPIKVDFVAYYCRDLLPDFMAMSTLERGVFWSLCSKIYEEGGRISNKTSFLASLSGLSEEEFAKHFPQIEHKFQTIGDYLVQKRCTKELKKAYKLIKDAKKGGQISAKLRKNKGLQTQNEGQGGWEGGGKGVGRELEQQDKTNTRTEENKNTNTSLAQKFFKNQDKSSMGDVLILYGAISPFFKIETMSQKTCLDNICRWASSEENQYYKEDRIKFHKQIVNLANEAKMNAKTNRWGYFLDSLRRNYGYIPPSKK